MSEDLHVQLGLELAERFEKVIPPGTKSVIIRALVESLVKEIELNGPGIIGLVLDKAFNIRSELLRRARSEAQHGKDAK